MTYHLNTYVLLHKLASLANSLADVEADPHTSSSARRERGAVLLSGFEIATDLLTGTDLRSRVAEIRLDWFDDEITARTAADRLTALAEETTPAPTGLDTAGNVL